MSALDIVPLEGARFGARITGFDPVNVTSGELERLWEAYRTRHGLLCFDFGRLLDIEELHALTAVFGENEFAPGMINGIGRRAAEGEENLTVEEQVERIRAAGRDPYLTFLGNVDPETLEAKPTNRKFFGEWEWHTDMSYIEVPPTFSLLHSRRVPASGGDTGFCSQVMAAAELPDELRARLQDLIIKHDSTYGSSGQLRPGMTVPESPIEAIGYPHPALRVVPSTGEEALFLGRRTNGYVLDRPLEESETLLDELWAHATQERFSYRHQWKVGEVIAWDNRMLLHKRHPFSDTDVRLMWRTQTKGEAVVPA